MQSRELQTVNYKLPKGPNLYRAVIYQGSKAKRELVQQSELTQLKKRQEPIIEISSED